MCLVHQAGEREERDHHGCDVTGQQVLPRHHRREPRRGGEPRQHPGPARQPQHGRRPHPGLHGRPDHRHGGRHRRRCVSVGPAAPTWTVSACRRPRHGISGEPRPEPGEADVRRLRVSNCTIAARPTACGSRRGAAAELAPPRSRRRSASLEDIVMRRVRNPIIIDQEYCPYLSCHHQSVRAHTQRSF